MSQIQKHSSVKGSLQSVANKSLITVAQAFVDCDVVVLLDVLASMMTADGQNYYHTSPHAETRYRKACNQLAKLQHDNPGKVCLICFDHQQTFEPSGIARHPNGSTDVAGALSYIWKADGLGLKFVLISDGEPDDDESAIAIARQFKSRIDCLFIGPEGSSGQDFLRRLAAVTGGKFDPLNTKGINQLCDKISAKLLPENV